MSGVLHVLRPDRKKKVKVSKCRRIPTVPSLLQATVDSAIASGGVLLSVRGEAYRSRAGVVGCSGRAAGSSRAQGFLGVGLVGPNNTSLLLSGMSLKGSTSICGNRNDGFDGRNRSLCRFASQNGSASICGCSPESKCRVERSRTLHINLFLQQ